MSRPSDRQPSSRLLLRSLTAALTLCSLSGLGYAAVNQNAAPNSRSMPIEWKDVAVKLFSKADEARLEKGEIIYETKNLNGELAVAQSVGLVNASPEKVIGVVKRYDQYTRMMPFTLESRVVNKFKLEGGPHAGAETVDFYSKVGMMKLETSYLLRIVHLGDPSRHLYQTFWTQVDKPGTTGCKDASNAPCENSLALNMGAHIIEPYKGNPNKSLHTYMLKLKADSTLLQMAVRAGVGQSIRDAAASIRKAAEAK